MKKVEKIAKYLQNLKDNHANIFNVWDMQNMLDLAESCIRGDITHKVARKMIYEECTQYLNTDAYDSAHADISLMCLPFVWA